MIETLVEIEHVQDFDEQGFYSKTYIAKDLRLNRIVAVKDLDAKALDSKQAVEVYFEEAQRLSLASHPRVLPVYFVGLNKIDEEGTFGNPRIVTKYIEGGSLNNLLKVTYANNKTLEIGTAIRFVHDIIQGMIHLHSLDIVHLDLKASNIFIGDDGKLILADFGQSKMLSNASIVKVDNLYPSILTPEAIRKRVGDKTTDIYQFGVLLYSIFNYDIYRKEIEENYKVNTETLLSIFKGEGGNGQAKEEFKANMSRLSVDIRGGKFPDRQKHHYYVPKVIQDVITKCLEVDVANRYANFHAIQVDINKLSYTNKAQNLVQMFDTNSIEFSKGDDNCRIEVVVRNDRFAIKVYKNDRAKNNFNKDNLTRIQLSKNILDAINDV